MLTLVGRESCMIIQWRLSMCQTVSGKSGESRNWSPRIVVCLLRYTGNATPWLNLAFIHLGLVEAWSWVLSSQSPSSRLLVVCSQCGIIGRSEVSSPLKTTAMTQASEDDLSYLRPGRYCNGGCHKAGS